jgi:hypothetical protein
MIDYFYPMRLHGTLKQDTIKKLNELAASSRVINLSIRFLTESSSRRIEVKMYLYDL